MQNPNEVPPLQTSASTDSIYSERPDSASIPRTDIEDRTPRIDPNDPAWGVWGALLVWVVSILVQAIIPLFVILPFAVHRGLDPASPDFARSALELAVSDRTAILLQILSIFPTHFLTFVIIWALVTRFGKRPFLASLGLNWSGWLGVLLSFSAGIVLFGAAMVLAKLIGAENPTKLEQLINSSLSARYAIAVLAVFTAPFIEEFLYRGVLYAALQRLIGVGGAIVFVLGLFTLIHVPQYWPNVGVISAVALLSVALTIVRA